MSTEEEESLYSFFISEDYVEKTWKFGDLEQNLLCSNMSSTDHDLTGQIVWPACVLLSWFIYGNKDSFVDKNVIELGAGCGLAGFVAARYCKHSLITDGNDIVVKLLDQNKEHLKYDNVDISKLLWGVKENVDVVYDSNESKYPDVIIGADVILWPNQIISLLYTIRWLLAYKQETSKCYISYIVRASSTTALLFNTAEKLGLKVEDVEISSFLSADCTFFDGSEKHLFGISIDVNSSYVFDPNSEEIKEYSKRIASEYSAC